MKPPRISPRRLLHFQAFSGYFLHVQGEHWHSPDSQVQEPPQEQEAAVVWFTWLGLEVVLRFDFIVIFILSVTAPLQRISPESTDRSPQQTNEPRFHYTSF